ncbi:MAG: hypothetical protein OCD00_20105 [Colwellia sp.]
MRKLIAVFLLYLFSVHVWAINVTLVLPKHEEHKFWHLVADAAKSAAKNSEVTLNIRNYSAYK